MTHKLLSEYPLEQLIDAYNIELWPQPFRPSGYDEMDQPIFESKKTWVASGRMGKERVYADSVREAVEKIVKKITGISY